MVAKKIAGLLVLVAVVLMVLSGLTLAETPKETAAAKININTASAETLMQLPGIGQSYAKRIVEYREANGPFSNIEELKNVKGIGDKIFEQNKDLITVGDKLAGDKPAGTAAQ
jgi:competence ComEA-like helix-hairpin-helix protein